MTRVLVLPGDGIGPEVTREAAEVLGLVAPDLEFESGLIGGGAIYLLLTVYGWVVDRHDDANFVPVDGADNWLHLVLGAGMIALALVFGRDPARTVPTRSH